MELLQGSWAQKKRRGQKLLLWLSFFVFLSLLAFYTGLQKIGRTILDQPLNILMLGIDAETEKEDPLKPELPRADTILFLALRPELKKAGLFSIPRDSLVDIPGVGRERINMAHAYGGSSLIRQTVEKVMEMPLHRFLVVDFEGFKELVDVVGGVEITVDKRMLYTDHSAGLRIDLQPGPQTLQGEDALGYVRYRQDPLGDITRVRRQQKFLTALAHKLRRKETVFELIKIAGIGRRYLQTDLTIGEMLALYWLFSRLDLEEDFFLTTLPGEFYLTYWRLHDKEINRLLEVFRAGNPPGPGNR